MTDEKSNLDQKDEAGGIPEEGVYRKYMTDEGDSSIAQD